MHKKKALKIAAGLIGISALLATATAEAVPSFARQTEMPCSACHTVFPELTQFGRQFKLNGYTLTGMKQVEQKPSSSSGGLKINEIPPLSAMLQVGETNISQGVPGQQNNDVQFPQQLSFFFAGEITPHIGSFIQITYAQTDQNGTDGGYGFQWDNTDIRMADRGKLGDLDVVYGLTLNNSPTVEDLWNTTPAWGFPFTSSATAPTPAASALLDGTLAQDSAGLGGYALFGNHLYAGVSFYRSAHLGEGQPSSGSSSTIKGASPYWRLAWQQDIGSSYFEIGYYGMYARLYPSGITGSTDDYTDNAADAQLEFPFGDDMLTFHGTYIHEKQQLGASAPGTSSNHLNEFRIDGIYHWGNSVELALGGFNTSGTGSGRIVAVDTTPVDGSANGSPNSTGYTAQLSYLPWENTKFTVQYMGYTKFNGGDSNYDGNGRSASDNNALYLQGWFMW